MLRDERLACASLLQAHDEHQEAKRQLKHGTWGKVLQDARVIGCTTTGAAIYKDVIDAAKVDLFLCVVGYVLICV